MGVKQFSDGSCESTPAHLLLTLTVPPDNPPPISSEWVDRADDVQPVKTFAVEKFGGPKLLGIRDELQSQLDNKTAQIQVSFNLRKSELLAQRRDLKNAVAREIPAAQTKLRTASENWLNFPRSGRQPRRVLLQKLKTPDWVP